MGINLEIDTERLVQAIARFGRTTRETRQVASRLAEVLPSRLRTIKQSFAHWSSLALAERLALTDENYLEHIEELTNLNAEARRAHIQYETHLMLFEARRTLRSLLVAKQRQKSSGSATRSRRNVAP